MNRIKAISNQVTNGKNATPTFGERQSDNSENNVVDFVLDQSEIRWYLFLPPPLDAQKSNFPADTKSIFHRKITLSQICIQFR